MKCIGVVKWFGGYNSKTARENNFGFIEDFSGKDVFLHKQEWSGQHTPRENDAVFYSLEEDQGKWKAIAAQPVVGNSFGILESYKALRIIEGSDTIFSKKSYLERALRTEFCECFSLASTDDLDIVFDKSDDTGLALKLLEGGSKWSENIEILSDLRLIEPLHDVNWDVLPISYFSSHEKEASEFLNRLPHDEAKQLVLDHLKKLPIALIFFLVMKEILCSEEELGARHSDLEDYIGSMIVRGSSDYPEYVSQHIEAEVNPKGGLRTNVILGGVIDAALFKKYLFDRNLKFEALFHRSEHLQNRIDMFILNSIFSLILAGNDDRLTYQVFLEQLWRAISDKTFDPIQQIEFIQSIFPSCTTMPNNLSCEAVYWKKQDTFLCRGKKCTGTKVKPDLSKSYLTFTIYDWFSHYKIDYLNENEPSSRDFPIKLAGYFNRVVEIYDVIHCRSCRSLMLPDMRYSRVEYTTVENGNFVKKDMAASYRLTVFKCANHTCQQYNRGYYINHCVGFGCYHIIDTRDLRIQCDAGLYVCKGCGSCCAEHAKSHPVGLCPDCGDTLQLYEGVGSTSTEYGNRFVKCVSSQCEFMISGKKLPKKFYLESCGPAEHVYDDGHLVRR